MHFTVTSSGVPCSAVQGQIESDLNELGRQQAKAVSVQNSSHPIACKVMPATHVSLTRDKDCRDSSPEDSALYSSIVHPVQCSAAVRQIMCKTLNTFCTCFAVS